MLTRLSGLSVIGLAAFLPLPLSGQAPTVSGLTLSDNEARRLLQIVPTVGYPVGPGKVEVSGQIPLAGRNLPTGVGIGVSYRTTSGLF